MDCREVKKLLIDYLDSSLDKHKTARIQKHLHACKDCSDELAGLKAYKNSLDSLETVTAPVNFLEKVHERLEKRTGLKKLLQTIFVPVKLKVPLEAAGAMAAAAAVIFVLRVQLQPRPEQIAYAPSVSEQELVKKKSMKETPEPLQKEMDVKVNAGKEDEAYESKVENGDDSYAIELETEDKSYELEIVPEGEAFGSGREDAGETIEEKPIELALLIKPRMSQVHDLPEAGLRAAMKADMKAAPSEKMKEGTTEDDELTAGMRFEEEPAESERAAMPVYSLDEAFSRVKNLIEDSAGNLISVEYKAETGIPHYITAEIPAENYTSFLERLYQIGEPEGIPTSENMKDQGFVLLQLELIFSF